ncbi:hydroxymethylglutaryl-CoA lyase [Roseibium aggregatum]|uniref:Hydroxymethylglutaryl-CoA lyase n=1 Tax=Roseibium aggregatum TaxID=187304 RepID=A0A939EKC0_9HYPH|nr:hydroxymethylglutaryl-CoA lyase [Roseibium aggregatum]MBN9673987.1 hydroxymethylglutaryl-CoA lyase [Roseibium aggregatum]
MSDFVTIFEMGPRDGLQNEKQFVPTERKIELVDKLSACGFRKIETTSFVSPKWVPQMADAQEVMEGIYRHPAVVYSVLTPNVKGYTAARRASADEVAIFGSASEGFSKKNINCSIAESIERFKPLLEKARDDEMPVRGYVSCVTDCPYDGPTPPEKVAEVAKMLFDLGCYEISLGDTIGAGTPETIAAMLDAVIGAVPADKLAGHYHDTKGRALDNIEVSLEKGLRTFDSAIGGLGGCPYAPGAKGNVATEAVVDLMNRLGYETGIKADALAEVAAFAKTLRSVAE